MTVSQGKKSAGAVEILAMTVSSGKKSAGAVELPANDLLVAEFNYIANAAFQANEDRARVSQFFFVT
jgi:hypothetical protein